MILDSILACAPNPRGGISICLWAECLIMLKRVFSSISASQISLIFIGLMFLLPFINTHHEHPITPFYSEWIAAALGLMAVFPLLGTGYWRNIQSGLKIPQVSLIFLGLTVILCVQWALGMLHSNQYALLILSYFTWAFSLAVLGSYLRRELGWEKLVSTLAWCLVVAGVINVGIVVLQFVIRTGGVIPFLPNLPSNGGALSQTNHFANFCALATASLIYLHAKQRFSSSFFYLLLVCFIVMLSLSGSRSVWLYLAALTILLAIMHSKTVKQEGDSTATHRAYRAGLLLLPAFVIIQIFIHYVLPNDLVSLPTERLLDGVTAKTSSVRLHFWYDSLRIFLQSPWLGVGAGKLITNTFLLADTPTAMASKRVFEHAHNLFLHVLAEMGISAFLIVLVGLWAWIKAFKWRAFNLETWWLISLLAILGIHSMLEYPLWFTFFLGIAAVLLGAGDEKIITINLPKVTNQFVRTGFMLMSLLGVVNLSTMLIANVKLENWIQKFANENVSDQSQLNWVQQYSLLSPYSELIQAMTMKINTNHIEEEVLLNQSVMNFRPFRTIAYQHALLLRLQGDNTNAKIQLNRALIAYPGKFESAVEIVPVKYKQQYLNLFSELQLAAANRDSKK